ncbi:MAG: LemA family protein [Bacilli bacterium]
MPKALLGAEIISIIVIVSILVIFILGCLIWSLRKVQFFSKAKKKIAENTSEISLNVKKKTEYLLNELQLLQENSLIGEDLLLTVKEDLSLLDQACDILTLSRINADAEAINRKVKKEFPDFSTSAFNMEAEGFLQTDARLKTIRKAYNSNVSIYNQELVVFPSSVVASLIKARPFDFFVVEEISD